jgi:hypothetical protein
MGIELNVCERHCVDEWINAIVIVKLEPCFRNETNVRP